MHEFVEIFGRLLSQVCHQGPIFSDLIVQNTVKKIVNRALCIELFLIEPSKVVF
jgi:hypothetical protein